jgi:DNA gyrase subunit A
MQESFSMIFLAVHNGQPRELPLPDAIRAFIEHRIDVVRRRTAFLLGKAREREHTLLGYQIALDYLDQVIRIIRNSNNRADARENLFAFFSGKRINLRGTELAGVTLDAGKYGVDTTLLPVALAPGEVGTLILSYRQIDAILELQLYRLTQLSIDEILNELNKVRDNIAYYESILASEKKLRGVIVDELTEIRDKYGDVRRTIIVDETAELQLEDLIADEQVAVTVSHSGYLKRTPISIYRQQRRGGTGRLGMKTREEDFVASLIVDSTHSYLLFFTNTGRVFWMKIYEIPDVGAAGKGKHMASMLALQPGEKIVSYLAVRNLKEEGKFILFATRDGLVKKTPLKDFSNVMARGIHAIKIGKNDELIGVRVTSGEDVIFLATREGMAMRFDETYRRVLLGENGEAIEMAETPEAEAATPDETSEESEGDEVDDTRRERVKISGLRPSGRTAGGVRGITLKKNDYVIGLAVTESPKSRDSKRDRFALERGLESKLAVVRNDLESAKQELQKLRDERNASVVFNEDRKKLTDTPEIKAARKSIDDSEKRLKKLDVELGLSECLILTVSENGFGKRTDVDEYRLTTRGKTGVINLNTTAKIGKVASIQLVDETTELMVISQFGKIIRIDTKTIRAAGRATMGVKLLDLDDADKVAAAVTIPPEEVKEESETKPTIQ